MLLWAYLYGRYLEHNINGYLNNPYFLITAKPRLKG